MATGPGHIGYDVFDKFIKLLLEEIMGAFFAPLLVISGAKLYFLGAVLPFALVYFRRWVGGRFYITVETERMKEPIRGLSLYTWEVPRVPAVKKCLYTSGSIALERS